MADFNFDQAAAPYLQLLVSWYQRMEDELVEELVTITRADPTYALRRQALEKLRADLAVLEQNAQTWDDRYLRDWYRAGGRLGYNSLRNIEGLPDDAPIPYEIPREALVALARDAAGQRSAFLGAILRQSDDYLRRLAAGEIAAGLGLGKDSYAVGKAIREGLIERVRAGQAVSDIAAQVMTATGVIYSDGSVHSLHSYGQMTGRTGLANALRQGQLDRFADMDVHVVRIPRNGTLCFRCAPYEGRCFATDAAGEAMGYPPLSVWLQNGAHPNCRHIAYIPVLTPTELDVPPADWAIGADDKTLYREWRKRHPELYDASRHGFGSTAEINEWRRANPDVPFQALRGPRWRYAGIEARRQQAIEDMLLEEGLTYAEAVARQTEAFMKTDAYARQRAKTGLRSPAAQARAVQDARD